ncbi:MAG: flippase-like domain-containing protein [Candidatus Heimdallarchaeota archaeon]|nr:flippase-like domain-containing protein [Candidatus Heimdallarchaeota archaeon]
MSFPKKSSLAIYSVSIIILISILIFINPENLIQKILLLGIWGLAILLILYLLDLFIRTYRWKLLLIAQGADIPLKSLFLPVCSALAINLFTIARAGEAVRIFSLKRNHGTKYSDTLSSIVIEQVLSIIGLLVVTTVSLFFIGNSLQTGTESQIIEQLILILFLSSGGGLAGIIIILIKPDIIYKVLNKSPNAIRSKLTSAYEAFVRGISDLRSKPTLLFQGIVTSSLVWLIEGLMLFIISLSVFSTFDLVDLSWVIAASCAGNITFIIPILPGAMGQYEVIIAIVLSNSPHYPGFDAAVIALIDRIAKSFLLGILGGYATLKLGGKEILRFGENYSNIKNNNNLDNREEGIS